MRPDAADTEAAVGPRPRRNTSRDAIIQAAQRLFLESGFGGVNMDDLAEAAGVSRRTLYNQFATKEDIFREMLARQWARLDRTALPPLETGGDVEDVLLQVSRALARVLCHPDYIALVRMVVAESRQFPWISDEYAQVGARSRIERLAGYLARLTVAGVLDCRNPDLAARQFLGLLNEPLLWPQVMGEGRIAGIDENEVIAEAVRMFLLRYRRNT